MNPAIPGGWSLLVGERGGDISPGICPPPSGFYSGGASSCRPLSFSPHPWLAWAGVLGLLPSPANPPRPRGLIPSRQPSLGSIKKKKPWQPFFCKWRVCLTCIKALQEHMSHNSDYLKYLILQLLIKAYTLIIGHLHKGGSKRKKSQLRESPLGALGGWVLTDS